MFLTLTATASTENNHGPVEVAPAFHRRSFEPPGAGDWVLVLDEAAKAFPKPGLP